MNIRQSCLSLTLAVGMLSLSTASIANVEEGQVAPDFTLPDIRPDAPAVTLSALQGSVVYVDFWASWCVPCLRSLPEINTLYQQYRDQGFKVLAITIDTELDHAEDFLLDLAEPIEYLVLSDIDSDVMYEYGVRGMPTSFLIDRDGVVHKVHEGYRDGDIELLEQALLPLL
jgi:cytochrome c biogenesis protein CcmG/thiol:disulfide interchange protein DsbE